MSDATTQPSPSFVKTWLLAARPKTLTAAAVPVIVGSALAHAHGSFVLGAAVAALLVAFFLQIGTNFANDLFDHLKGADDDERLGPTRVTASGMVSVKQIAIACGVAFTLAFLSGLYLVSLAGWPLLVLGVLSIASGVAYTGGPFPLAYNALGDVFVFLFFGLVATVGTYYTQTLELHPMAFGYATTVGAMSTAILIVNNLRDHVTDKKHNKITTAVLLGPTKSRLFYLSMLILGYAVPVAAFVTGRAPATVLLALGSIPVAGIALKNVWTREGRELNAVLAQTSIVLLLTCVLMAVGIVL